MTNSSCDNERNFIKLDVNLAKVSSQSISHAHVPESFSGAKSDLLFDSANLIKRNLCEKFIEN